ncbi:MAG: hypothetical protein H7Y88_10610 [Phycisphaerales bacterium]|nr:hypothetical protein [Phycisphaerales bacterium]
MIVRVADLAEAEGRLLKRNVVKLSMGAAIGLVAAVLLLGGAVMLMIATYMAVADAASPPVAALVVGLAAAMVGGVLLWAMARMNR